MSSWAISSEAGWASQLRARCYFIFCGRRSGLPLGLVLDELSPLSWKSRSVRSPPSSRLPSCLGCAAGCLSPSTNAEFASCHPGSPTQPTGRNRSRAEPCARIGEYFPSRYLGCSPIHWATSRSTPSGNGTSSSTPVYSTHISGLFENTLSYLLSQNTRCCRSGVSVGISSRT